MNDFEIWKKIMDEYRKNERKGAEIFLNEFYDTIVKAVRSVRIPINCILTEDDLIQDAVTIFLVNKMKIIHDWGKGPKKNLPGYIFITTRRHTLNLITKENGEEDKKKMIDYFYL